MSDSNKYLLNIVTKYSPAQINYSDPAYIQLLQTLEGWAHTCFIECKLSGSIAKGTAISLSSDLDLMISLTNGCKSGLKEIYESLYDKLRACYQQVRKQNVSVRVIFAGGNLLLPNKLEIDITPARKCKGNTNEHIIRVSKFDTWKKTNTQQHINDISNSNRLNEIKLLKIWRELNQLEFPSIYMEYLLINIILRNKQTSCLYLADNFFYILSELAKQENNPLFSRVVDPANTQNILSELLTKVEKQKIQSAAVDALKNKYWQRIVW